VLYGENSELIKEYKNEKVNVLSLLGNETNLIQTVLPFRPILNNTSIFLQNIY